MELFVAIAMLCQSVSHKISQSTAESQLNCQQYYVHCINIKSSRMTEPEAMTKCIMERKL